MFVINYFDLILTITVQQKSAPKIVSLSTLRPGTDGYHLVVKVMEVIPVVDKMRRDRTRVRVALIVIADAEASVVFVARGGLKFLLLSIFYNLLTR